MSDTPKRTYPHGSIVEPVYTSGPELDPGFRTKPWWTMVQEHTIEKEFSANDWAINRLHHGASGLLFYVNSDHYLPRVLRDIKLSYVNIGLVVEGSGPDVMEALLHHAHDDGNTIDGLQGFINIDPVEIAARTGVWHEEKMYDLGEISRLAPSQFKYMCCNANFFGACGASAATQLGLAAAHLDFYLDAFGEVGYTQYWLALTSGTYLFEEIAKHRGIRLLWARLLEEYKLPPTHLELYSETSTMHQTAYDEHSNLLRATSAAFGAIVGGADSVQIRPYNALTEGADPEGERLALNQHYILAYESYLDRVEDPAAGSYFIETKTEELCAEAWDLLQKIRELGGIVEALRNGWVQDKLATEVQAAIPEKFLGVNIFPEKSQVLPADLQLQPLKSRTEHQLAHKDSEIEPLIPVRWAANLEHERLIKESAKQEGHVAE